MDGKYIDRAMLVISKFGRKHQILKALEELGELSSALSWYLALCETPQSEKNLVQQETAADAVKEEMADVRFMLQQLQVIFSVSDGTLEAIIDIKTERALKQG